MGSSPERPIGESSGLRRLLRSALRTSVALMERVPTVLFSRTVQFGLDALLTAIALFLAYQLRFDGSVPYPHRTVMWAWMLLLPVVRPALMWAFGGYDRIWRYFNLHDAIVLGITALPPTFMMLVVRYGFAHKLWVAQVPASVIAMEFMLFLALGAGLRSFRRITFESARRSGARRRALIVGTEDSVASALRHVAAHPDMHVVGVLAPDARLHGMRIGGAWVLDEPSALPKLLAARSVDVVLIADAGLDSVGEIVATATDFGVDVRLLPSASNVLHGEVRVSTPPDPARVFSKEAVAAQPPHSAVVEAFHDRVVLITGAGGSIGSELARQVASLPVRGLVLFDQDENSIFEIHSELLESGVGLFPLVGDIRDRKRLRRVFERHRPHVVLHAAAYKHVPVMENNCCEAIANNVLGTRNVTEMAIEHAAQRFLMISTDKAVFPTSVMGASKRVAELLVQSRAATLRRNGTRLACVRFGNVVGSRGSVVPIFLRQIAAGEPLTITDPEMTRYFMTIPEAVQLVLQASTLGEGGDIYMLDMGDPVKITTLARKLIEMSGLVPDKDIQIRFVGARPGEKLTERLWTDEAKVGPTIFPRVLEIEARPVPANFEGALAQLEDAAIAQDEALARERLEAMPIGFNKGQKAAAAASV